MPPTPGRRAVEQLPLFTAADLLPSAPKRPAIRRLRTPYLTPILRFVLYHRAATVGQIHREFFAATGKRRQYCAHLLKSFETHGYLQTRRVKRGLTGRPMLAYLITADGANAVGVEPTEKVLPRFSATELQARLQLVEVIQVRTDDGWRSVRPDLAFRFLKRWALKMQANTVVDRSALMLLGKRTDTTPMRHNILIRGGKDGVPAEVRVLLLVAAYRNMRRNLKGLPSFYGMPLIVFEVVLLDQTKLAEVKKALDRLAKKRKFRYAMEVVPSYLTRPLPDTMTREQLIADARKPAGWEPWMRSV